MDGLSVDATIDRDGEISVKGLPFKKGEHVKMTIVREPGTKERLALTGRSLLASRLVGIWADRTDIDDSVVFAGLLRERAQSRRG